MEKISAVSFVHELLQKRVPAGGFCIDATAGKGWDTLFLAQLVGPSGKVLAFDIQPQAVAATRHLLQQEACFDRVEVLQESHANMEQYAAPDSVDAIVFNFGYLPGGNHTIATSAQTSVRAVKKGLNLLKPGGVMGLCVYQGGDTGYAEKDAVLKFLRELDSKKYAVLVCSFYNHHNAPPIPAVIIKK